MSAAMLRGLRGCLLRLRGCRGGPMCRTLALGAAYVALSSSRVMLIKLSSSSDGGFAYLPASVNLAAEALKLIVCLTLTIYSFLRAGRKLLDVCVGYCWCSSVRELVQLLRWAVPGSLYCADNLIAFYVVSLLDPAVAVLLGNFVIITTALLFRIVLKRRLSSTQWAALGILFLAIVGLGTDNEATGPHRITTTTTTTTTTTSTTAAANNEHNIAGRLAESPLNLTDWVRSQGPHEGAGFHRSARDPAAENVARWDATPRLLGRSARGPAVGERAADAENKIGDRIGVGSGWRLPHPAHALVLLQCAVASAANVYNEKIFKDGAGASESIFLQNSRLYGFGVAFNAAPLAVQAWLRRPGAGGARGAASAAASPGPDGGPRGNSSGAGWVAASGTDGRSAGTERATEHPGGGWLWTVFGGHGPASLALVAVTALQGLTVAFILKFRDNMFHVLTAQLSAVAVAGASAAALQFRPGAAFALHAPLVPLAVFVYAKAGRAGGGGGGGGERRRTVEWATGERSCGDGEELESLTKPLDNESDSDAL